MNAQGHGNNRSKDFNLDNVGHKDRLRKNSLRLSRQKRCYTCNKIGYRSTTHSPEERKAAFSDSS